ncbi:hypothetical protein C8Q78DRAFT_1048282 [Trametes maxima]|nr:hypothetical protein C8Q78DRAFT_1048282 [Trametes maxima]
MTCHHCFGPFIFCMLHGSLAANPSNCSRQRASTKLAVTSVLHHFSRTRNTYKPGSQTEPVFSSALVDYIDLPPLGIPSLDSTIGSIYLGLVLGMMMYGLTVHQTYRYFKMYPSDRIYIKTLVTIIVTLETMHSAIWVAFGYHYMVKEILDIAGLLKVYWLEGVATIVTAFAVIACQAFYAFRVFFSEQIGPGYRWLVMPAVTTMVVGLGFAIAAAIISFTRTPLIPDLRNYCWLFSIAYGMSAVTDVILTGALAFVLHRSRTGSKRTNSVLDMLIIYTINTGLLTSITSILSFVFALILPGNLIYAGIGIVGAKIYANSVLAVYV